METDRTHEFFDDPVSDAFNQAVSVKSLHWGGGGKSLYQQLSQEVLKITS